MIFFKKVVENPVRVLCFIFLISALAFVGILEFKIQNNPRVFFSPESSDYLAFQDFENKYGTRENIIFIVSNRGDSLFNKKALSILKELTEEGSEIPNSSRVQSITNFPRIQVDGDEISINNLIEDPLSLSNEEIHSIEKFALGEPSLKRKLISESGTVAMVMISVNLAADDFSNTSADKAQVILKRYKNRYPDLDFMLLGTLIYNQALTAASEDVFIEVFPLALICIVLFLYLFLRSLLGVVATLLLIGASNAIAIGVMGQLGIKFMSITSYAPVMIMTLAIADCMHILVTYNQFSCEGMKKRDAVMESLRVNAQPVILTSVTTAIGFLGMNLAESPVFHDLGNIVSLGVIVAMFLSFTLLPAFIMIWPETRTVRKNVWLHRFVIRIGELVIAHSKMLLLIGLAVTPLMVVGLSKIEFNDEWQEYFKDGYDISRAFDFVNSNMEGVQIVEFSIPSKGEGGINEPDYLRNLEAFERWANAQQEVVYTSSIINTVKTLNQKLQKGEDTKYSIPVSREIAAQNFLVYELSLPLGADLENQVTIDKSETYFGIVLRKSTSKEVGVFGEKANLWIENNFPSYMQTKPTGIDLLFNGISLRNIKSMLLGTLIALILISILIWISLRSIKYGLLSLIPNLLPAVISFGIWGIFVGEVGLTVSVVGCLTLGIIVDDTVHFVSKYLRARKEKNLNSIEAIRYSFRTVGVALVATSLVLAINFSLQLKSQFYPASSLGVLASITVIVALIIDLLLFASLLLLIDGEKSTNR